MARDGQVMALKTPSRHLPVKTLLEPSSQLTGVEGGERPVSLHLSPATPGCKAETQGGPMVPDTYARFLVGRIFCPELTIPEHLLLGGAL